MGTTIPNLGRIWEGFLGEVTYKLRPRAAIKGLGQEPPLLITTSLTLLSAPAGLFPMDEGPNTLARAAAAKPVTLTNTDPLLSRHPASASAEELVPGFPQAHHGPTRLPQATHERQREDVLHDG